MDVDRNIKAGTTLEGDLSEVLALFCRHFAPDEPTGEKIVAVKFMDFFLFPPISSTVQYCVLLSELRIVKYLAEISFPNPN